MQTNIKRLFRFVTIFFDFSPETAIQGDIFTHPCFLFNKVGYFDSLFSCKNIIHCFLAHFY